LRLSYHRGNIAGDDANFDIRDERLASFTSPISEMALRFDFDAPSDQESFFRQDMYLIFLQV